MRYFGFFPKDVQESPDWENLTLGNHVYIPHVCKTTPCECEDDDLYDQCIQFRAAQTNIFKILDSKLFPVSNEEAVRRSMAEIEVVIANAMETKSRPILKQAVYAAKKIAVELRSLKAEFNKDMVEMKLCYHIEEKLRNENPGR